MRLVELLALLERVYDAKGGDIRVSLFGIEDIHNIQVTEGRNELGSPLLKIEVAPPPMKRI